MMRSILFVCTGNICRSPTADGVMRTLLEQYKTCPEYRFGKAKTGISENRSVSVHLSTCAAEAQEHLFAASQSRDYGQVLIDSAGTHAYHIGEAPDARTQKVALERGYDLSFLRARKVTREDFTRFDLILAMDQDHYHILDMLRPQNATAELALFLEYAGLGKRDVPDPYYGGIRDFEMCLDLVEEGCRKLLERISK